VSDWPIGLSTGCFYKHRIFDILELVRKGGFLMIEICSSPPHLDYHDTQGIKEAAKLIKKLGMEVYSFHAPFAENIDITSLDKGQREYSQNELLQAAEAASLLGSRFFVTHPGPEKEYFNPRPEELVNRMQNAAKVLNLVSERCNSLGVGFVLENMLPHLFFGNVRDMLWLIGSIESINVGACMDTGHAYLSGDVYRVMYKLSSLLQVVHANDNLGQGDDHLPPGKGRINWPQIMKELDETGFVGGIILELAGHLDRPPETVLEEARAAHTYLREISKKLTLSKPPTVGHAY
jgi:sugar phosphate isomerase/epimerase